MLGNLRKRLNCSLMLFMSYFHPFLVVVPRKKTIRINSISVLLEALKFKEHYRKLS